MKKHFDNLLKHIPDLISLTILDLGSGRGDFLIECSRRGSRAMGLEYNSEYIDITKKLASEQNLDIEVIQGTAENMPFLDESFDFVNIAEVIEHVNSPEQLLRELYRILKPGAKAYISIPNRFGLFDQHFHLYLINWLPRSLAYIVIGLFGKHKDYSGLAGRQNILNMHYYTFYRIKKVIRKQGFSVVDIRRKKIQKKFNVLTKFFIVPFYIVAMNFFFNSFHLLLTKTKL